MLATSRASRIVLANVLKHGVHCAMFLDWLDLHALSELHAHVDCSRSDVHLTEFKPSCCEVNHFVTATCNCQTDHRSRMKTHGCTVHQRS